MKRIVVGLMILGLVIGGFLSCVLNAPDEVDQTQVDSVLATLSADGAFGQEISRTVESGEVIDGWEYNAAGALGDATKTTLTFMTDGTWEWKVEAFEAAAKTESGSTQVAETEDGDAATGEGWVQTDGFKGTYSYDVDTMTLTVNYGGIYFLDDTTPAYTSAWNITDNDIDGDEELMASKKVVFVLFDEDILDDFDVALDTDDSGATDLTGEDNIATCVLAAFDNGTDVYAYFGSPYVEMTKNYIGSATIAAPDYAIVTDTTDFTMGETEITYWMTSVTKTDLFTGTDSYVNNAATAKRVYEVVFDGVLANGSAVTIEEAYQTKNTAVASFSTTTGAYTYDTTYTILRDDVTAIGGYDTFQMYGDGYIAY